ncbi:uncharacterized protein J3R85_011938 [Psidium guajava]|nr:uncharacterized protein J3R85_011938 [Psidium guajava]
MESNSNFELGTTDLRERLRFVWSRELQKSQLQVLRRFSQRLSREIHYGQCGHGASCCRFIG